MKNKTGTYEWAKRTRNIFIGCQHGCKYCYARAIKTKFNQFSNEWTKPILDTERYNLKFFHMLKGDTMYPSTHDIHPDDIDFHINFLQRLLPMIEGKLIIVSKPHIESIKEICTKFKDSSYKESILFRFSIGSIENETLKYWEPFAPSFEERLECLQYAYHQGFQTSVSCEPMLDDCISSVISRTNPFVSESIWIGKANQLKARMTINGFVDKEDVLMIEQLEQWQNDKAIINLFRKYRHNDIIKWKDSISKVIEKHGIIL